MLLEIKKTLSREIIHYADDQLLISSQGRKVYVDKNGQKEKITLPFSSPVDLFSWLRLARRALRTDKCNVFPVPEGLVIIRRGIVYHYDTRTKQLTPTLQLKNCRNVLHQSIGQAPNGNLYFGEYGNNGERRSVPVYRSTDSGKSWEVIYTFQPGEIKHVHGCFYDPVEDKIWVATGDFESENWLLVADTDFKKVEKIGNGQQQYRTCNLFFEKEKVHWLMDSQLEPSFHIILDRKTRKINVGQRMQGPVWYIKRLKEGTYLAATAQEIGPGVLDEYVHLVASKDLETWETLQKFHHDGLPKRYFKFGVIGFADGEQSDQHFYMFFEAVKGYDGKSVTASIKND